MNFSTTSGFFLTSDTTKPVSIIILSSWIRDVSDGAEL